VPSSNGAPPAGPDAAGPRPDLRGHRLAVTALLGRAEEGLEAKRLPGFVGGLLGGLAAGTALLLAGVPGVVAILAAAAVNLLLAFWLPTLLLPAPDRRLLAVTDRLVAHFGLAWRRAYGKEPIPKKEEHRLLWLAAQPPATTDPDALDIEAGFYLDLGRYQEARDRAERLPETTPWWQFVRALARAEIEFDEGGRGDLSAAREAAERIHGARRTVAIVNLGLADAARAMIRGDDWDPPIARAVAATGWPIFEGIAVGLARTRAQMPWLIASELALAVVLYFVAVRPVV
jgi:hypothetical protein